ncbi:MAG: zinc ribbon domain-containing protein [Actinomycetota bacterium]
MARGGRCPACDEELVGAARFCAACGAPVGAGSLTVAPNADEVGLAGGQPLVRDGSRWPMLAGVLVVAGLVAALALSRIGDDSSSAAEPPPDTTAAPTTTTTPSPTTTTTPPTTIPPTTSSVPPGFVDVSEVPADLADTTLIVFDSNGDVAALDLGTGQLTPFESPFDFRGEDQITSSPFGIVVQRWTANSSTTALDWDLRELATLSEASAFQTVDDGMWALDWDGTIQLRWLGESGPPIEARSFDGWANLVGTIDGDALIANAWSGATHRIATDGTTIEVGSGLAIAGGRDWMIAVECDQALVCTSNIWDFRSGRVGEMDLGGTNFSLQPSDLSWDGRRALVTFWGTDGPDEFVVVDADQMTMEPAADGISRFAGPGGGDHDRELRHYFRPAGDITIIDLATGDEVTIETEENVRNVLVAPPGWEPPASAD